MLAAHLPSMHQQHTCAAHMCSSLEPQHHNKEAVAADQHEQAQEAAHAAASVIYQAANTRQGSSHCQALAKANNRSGMPRLDDRTHVQASTLHCTAHTAAASSSTTTLRIDQSKLNFVISHSWFRLSPWALQICTHESWTPRAQRCAPSSRAGKHRCAHTGARALAPPLARRVAYASGTLCSGRAWPHSAECAQAPPLQNRSGFMRARPWP